MMKKKTGKMQKEGKTRRAETTKKAKKAETTKKSAFSIHSGPQQEKRRRQP